MFQEKEKEEIEKRRGRISGESERRGVRPRSSRHPVPVPVLGKSPAAMHSQSRFSFLAFHVPNTIKQSASGRGEYTLEFRESSL